MVHNHNHKANTNLKVAFFLNLAFTVFEIIGGFFVNSVAILSDAIHDLGDSIALGTAWFLQSKSNQKPDKKFSFGYHRFSLLGALINCVVLIGGSIYVLNEAYQRLLNPETSDALGMIAFSIVGIAVNGYAAYKLSGGKTLNEKVVSWHLLEDVLGWVAVLIVAVILYFKHIPYLDPALSIAITLYVLYNVIKRLKETLYLFLQGTPEDIDQNDIELKIVSLEHVHSVHHTHIWSLEGEHHVFSTHVKLNPIASLSQLKEVKCEVQKILNRYPFKHFTIELEQDDEDCGLD